jgi:RNA polymerase sigma factor (sigma-70 family)
MTGSGTLLEERHLHRRLMARDPPALAEVYDQFSPAVFGVALRVTSDRSAAEDVTQSVFVELWRQPERFDPDQGSLRPWLAAIAHHRGVDWLRQQQAAGRCLTPPAELAVPPDVTEAVEAVLMGERVRAALARLPEEERIPIRLAYFGGRTYSDVAVDLGLSESTVKARIRTGLRRMATTLQPEVLRPGP